MYKKQIRLKAIHLLDQIILPIILWGIICLVILSNAFDRIYHKRSRIRILHFLEQILLPFVTTLLILLFAFIIAIGVFGVRFSSPIQMVVILGLIIFVVGGLVFEISRQLIKKVLRK